MLAEEMMDQSYPIYHCTTNHVRAYFDWLKLHFAVDKKIVKIYTKET